jgi:hypothetical protein
MYICDTLIMSKFWLLKDIHCEFLVLSVTWVCPWVVFVSLFCMQVVLDLWLKSLIFFYTSACLIARWIFDLALNWKAELFIDQFVCRVLSVINFLSPYSVICHFLCKYVEFWEDMITWLLDFVDIVILILTLILGKVTHKTHAYRIYCLRLVFIGVISMIKFSVICSPEIKCSYTYVWD